jgi:hypothetical protein
MALPMNTMPTFTLTVPSTGKPVKYRPFLVKEEKALMIAQQSEDPGVMIDTLKGVIKSCVIDDINVDSLAVFDLEYIFTQIRGKSVGEIVELMFACDNDHGEQNDKAKSKIKVDLSTIEVTRDPSHTNKIMLFGDCGVVMKYPNVNVIKQLEIGTDDVSEIFNIVVASIDCIFQGDDIYYAHEQSKEELNQFLNNLTSEQFKKIQTFFETMPKLTTTVEYKCPICNKEHKKVLEGLQSFFS